MAELEPRDNQRIELSSDSDPEDIDLDELNDIQVDASDLDELDQLFATTKKEACTTHSTQSSGAGKPIRARTPSQ